MKYLPILETERLIIRPISMDDLDGFFEMDSNPNVHTYLGNKSITTKDQAKKYIEGILNQYDKFGIARWAVEDKETHQFLGWTGFKYIDESEPINGKSDFLDIGYRYIEDAWGKGISSEAAFACKKYYDEYLTHYNLHAFTDKNNAASRRVLEKIGLEVTNEFHFDALDIAAFWYDLKQ